MSFAPQKSLVEMSEKELLEALRHVSKNVNYGYNDVLHELERKRMVREAGRTFRLSVAAIIIAGLSLFASLLLALFR